MSWKIEMSNLLNALWRKRSAEIVIGCIAQIESHDVPSMRADIKPLLFYTENGTKRSNFAIIPDVPVLFFNAGGYVMRPKYRRNDLVWVTFATFEISEPLNGRYADTSKSIFARENAAVVMGLSGSSFTPPAGFSGDGIFIAHESGSMKMELSQNRIKATVALFEVEGDVKVSGKIDAAGNVSTESDVIWQSASTPTHASTHTHMTGVGMSSTPKPRS